MHFIVQVIIFYKNKLMFHFNQHIPDVILYPIYIKRDNNNN